MNNTRMTLERVSEGDESAREELLTLVYGELRRLAAAKMAREAPGQTLQPTALVHEAWLKLRHENHRWEDRQHFFACAAEAMRRILIDRARRRKALRRGGGVEVARIDDVEIAAPTDDSQLLALQEALDALEKLDAKKADLVKLRYFVGMTIQEAGEALGISLPTANRWWAFSRAWLLARAI